MGHNWIAGILDTGTVDLRHGLTLHFQHNIFPPVNLVFIDAAVAAIENAQADEWDEEIELPNGKILTAGEIINQLHLDAFLEDYEDEDGELWD